MDVLNRVMALFLALALAAAGLLVAAEVAHTWVEDDGSLLVSWRGAAERLQTTSWDAGSVLLVSIVALVVGLALAVGQLRPRRPGLLLLDTHVDGLQAGLRRKTMTAALAATLSEVDGVSSTKVRFAAAG